MYILEKINMLPWKWKWCKTLQVSSWIFAIDTDSLIVMEGIACHLWDQILMFCFPHWNVCGMQHTGILHNIIPGLDHIILSEFVSALFAYHISKITCKHTYLYLWCPYKNINWNNMALVLSIFIIQGKFFYIITTKWIFTIKISWPLCLWHWNPYNWKMVLMKSIITTTIQCIIKLCA